MNQVTKQDKQVRNLLRESNLTEYIDDPEFDKQAYVAWKFLCGITDVRYLTHYDIRKVQRILTLLQTDLQPEDRGFYRKKKIMVGSDTGAPPEHMDRYMTRWLADLPLTTPEEAHIEFEKIHPFIDGNGRTGRILMWWHQMLRGEALTNLSAEDRDEYYGWFK